MNGYLKCSQYLLHAHIILSIWWSTCDLLLVNVNSKLLFKENFVVRLVLYIATAQYETTKRKCIFVVKVRENPCKQDPTWHRYYRQNTSRPGFRGFPIVVSSGTRLQLNHIDNLPMKPRHFYCLVMNEIQIYIKFIF